MLLADEEGRCQQLFRYKGMNGRSTVGWFVEERRRRTSGKFNNSWVMHISIYICHLIVQSLVIIFLNFLKYKCYKR